MSRVWIADTCRLWFNLPMERIKLMKNKCLLFIPLSLFCASTSFGAMTVTLTTNPLTGSNGGGEFTAVTSDNGTFATYCIDPSHYFTPGVQYNYVISQSTTDPMANNISIGTAYLYSQFLAGSLGTWSTSKSTLLQKTFWALEGEGYASILNSGNMFYNALISKFATIGAAEADAGANNSYGVAVMNLTDRWGNRAQSQLVQIPPPSGNSGGSVPEPSTIAAAALLLLPLGVSAIRILRRKQSAQN